MELTLRYRSPALDFGIAIESSTDLKNWAALDLELDASSQEGAFTTVTRRLTLPAGPVFFVRLRATNMLLNP